MQAIWGRLSQALRAAAGAGGPVAKIPADTQIAHLNGNAWGFGWNAGILYELDKNNRYGLTYRSEVKIDFDGNYRSSLPAAYNQILGNFGLPANSAARRQMVR